MGKPAAKKIAAAKQHAAEERPAVKKSGSSKTASAKEEKKITRTPRAAAVKKTTTKSAAKAPAKSGAKTKITSPKTKTAKDLPKTARKSLPSAKTSAVAAAPKKTGKEPQKAARMSSPVSAAMQDSRAVARDRAGKGPATSARKPAVRASAGKKVPPKTGAKTASGGKTKPAGAAIAPAVAKSAKKAAPASAKKTSRPKAALSLPVVARRKLPEEYGESEVILMPVDPNVIFVDWEIKKEDLPAADTPVAMRVRDVTAHRKSGVPAGRSFDLPLGGRIGCGFFDIGMPGREVAVEIGPGLAEGFSPVLKSTTVSMPRPIDFDDAGIAESLFESGGPVGY